MCCRVKRTLLFTAASPYLPSWPLSQQHGVHQLSAPARQPLPCTSSTGLCAGLPLGRLSSTQPTKFPQSPTRALYHPAGPGLCCVPVSLHISGACHTVITHISHNGTVSHATAPHGYNLSSDADHGTFDLNTLHQVGREPSLWASIRDSDRGGRPAS